MALINTTESMKTASTVLGEKAEKTKANMDGMAKMAGCEKDPRVTVFIPMTGKTADVVSVGLNGVTFYIRRGEPVSVPKAVAEVLYNCQIIFDDPNVLATARKTVK